MLVAENESQTVLTATENGFGKRTPISEYTRHGRGTKGMIAIQTGERNGNLVGAVLVEEKDEVMLVSTGGVVIRTKVAQIREQGRSTQGVTLINLDEGTRLAGIEKVLESDDEDGTATATATATAEAKGARPKASDARRHPLRVARCERIIVARVFNFSAGPAVLPETVLQQAAAEMLDWHGSGMSVMEMSHRGKEFISIHAEAEKDLRELLAVPANYKVLFLQGGAIAENAIVPMNLLRGRSVADYVNTGEWSKKSIKEAKKYCSVNVAASSEDKQLHLYPAAVELEAVARTRATSTSAPTRPSAAWSITGCPTPARCRWWPTCPRISCRARWTSAKYGLIYAGAQKNIGPAGLTLVIVRDDLIGQAAAFTPSAFDYKQQAEADSMFNTPPTYAIYIAGLVFKWAESSRAGWPRSSGATSPRPSCCTTTSTRANSSSARSSRATARA